MALQGGNNIVVEIPGKKRGDLVNTVKQTAQLRFRLVALTLPGQPQASPSASPSGSASPSALRLPVGLPVQGEVVRGAQGLQERQPQGPCPLLGPGRGRLGQGQGDQVAVRDAAAPAAKATASPSALPTAAPSAGATTSPVTKAGAPVDQPLKWMDNPGTAWLQKFYTPTRTA